MRAEKSCNSWCSLGNTDHDLGHRYGQNDAETKKNIYLTFLGWIYCGHLESVILAMKFKHLSY